MKGPVTVIGGANMDINAFSREPLNMEDSNPGKIEYCPGGVGRNIAENLHRLGAEVRFISVIGDDPGGEFIRASSSRIGLNIGHSLFLDNEQDVTSVYVALMDYTGELKLAISDMSILERMTTEHLESKADLIQESAVVVLDANLAPKIIRFIIDRFGSTERVGASGPLFFFDAVSAKKVPRAASLIGSFDTIKMGRMEASALTGIKLSDRDLAFWEKLDEAAAWLINKGVRRVFITLGKEGVYAAQADKFFFSPIRYVQPVNTSGSGDAFMAGIVYGTLNDWDAERTISFSTTMARLTVLSRSAVSPEMCLELVQREL
jgi:pseudouridine kinase